MECLKKSIDLSAWCFYRLLDNIFGSVILRFLKRLFLSVEYFEKKLRIFSIALLLFLWLIL